MQLALKGMGDSEAKNLFGCIFIFASYNINISGSLSLFAVQDVFKSFMRYDCSKTVSSISLFFAPCAGNLGGILLLCSYYDRILL